ncbi:MAG: hypothetical protein HC800_19015 [Phormidesmis sp. RL_2_1]|nr:hypothetical protein [Phormidesmis sp. RL_2_1]
MEENFSVSLLTPASDLVGGSSSAEFEIIFARAGNDVLFPFDPAVTYPEINIDFMFGDIFDNSADEFEVVLGLTQDLPLGILEKNIPSVGRDRFVLGDERGVFYTAPHPLNLLSTNLLGSNEFAVIYDFGRGQDIIQLSGEAKDYSLIEVNNLVVEGVAQPFSGEAIFYHKGAVPDLIGFIISTPEEDYDLKDKDVFEFVGHKGDKGGDDEVLRLGTPGFDLSQNTTIDRFGNIYVVGSTRGSLGGFNQGAGDVFIAKYTNKGNRLWLRQLGSSGSEDAYEVVTDDNGDVYIAGNTSGNLVGIKQASDTDAWVAKLSGYNGDLIWGKQFNAGGQLGQATFANTAFGLDFRNGAVYVSGLAINDNQKINPLTGQPFLDFSVEDDSWVTKLSAANGEQQWITQIIDPLQPPGLSPLAVTPFFDENYDLAVDAAGNSYLVGWTQGLAKESDPSRLLLKIRCLLG